VDTANQKGTDYGQENQTKEKNQKEVRLWFDHVHHDNNRWKAREHDQENRESRRQQSDLTAAAF
jgi:hypothetical protein